MVDLYIAGGLVGIVIITFLLARMKLLTRKTLPYIILALLAALGIGYFQVRRRDKAKERIKNLEKEIKARKDKIKHLEKENEVEEGKLKAIDAELDKKLAAHKKQSLLEEAKNKEERERLKNLSDPEILAEFNKAFGS
jgi:uncharacterized protein YacL